MNDVKWYFSEVYLDADGEDDRWKSLLLALVAFREDVDYKGPVKCLAVLPKDRDILVEMFQTLDHDASIILPIGDPLIPAELGEHMIAIGY